MTYGTPIPEDTTLPKATRFSRRVEALIFMNNLGRENPWDFSPDEKPSILQLPAPGYEPGTWLGTLSLQGSPALSTRPQSP